MHENHGQTIRALPTISAALARRRLRAVTVPGADQRRSTVVDPTPPRAGWLLRIADRRRRSLRAVGPGLDPWGEERVTRATCQRAVSDQSPTELTPVALPPAADTALLDGSECCARAVSRQHVRSLRSVIVDSDDRLSCTTPVAPASAPDDREEVPAPGGQVLPGDPRWPGTTGTGASGPAPRGAHTGTRPPRWD